MQFNIGIVILVMVILFNFVISCNKIKVNDNYVIIHIINIIYLSIFHIILKIENKHSLTLVFYSSYDFKFMLNMHKSKCINFFIIITLFSKLIKFIKILILIITK